MSKQRNRSAKNTKGLISPKHIQSVESLFDKILIMATSVRTVPQVSTIRSDDPTDWDLRVASIETSASNTSSSSHGPCLAAATAALGTMAAQGKAKGLPHCHPHLKTSTYLGSSSSSKACCLVQLRMSGTIPTSENHPESTFEPQLQISETKQVQSSTLLRLSWQAVVRAATLAFQHRRCFKEKERSARTKAETTP